MGIDFDAVTEWLEDNEAPAEVKAAFDSSKLRKELADKVAEIQRLKPFEDKVTKLERKPVLESAFKEHASVDLDGLTKAQRKLLEDFTWEGDTPDPEAVTAFASEWEFPTDQSAEAVEQSQAQQFAQHSTQAPKHTPAPANLDEQIAEAEAAGDYKAAIRLKAQKLKPAGMTATPA